MVARLENALIQVPLEKVSDTSTAGVRHITVVPPFELLSGDHMQHAMRAMGRVAAEFPPFDVRMARGLTEYDGGTKVQELLPCEGSQDLHLLHLRLMRLLSEAGVPAPVSEYVGNKYSPHSSGDSLLPSTVNVRTLVLRTKLRFPGEESSYKNLAHKVALRGQCDAL